MIQTKLTNIDTNEVTLLDDELYPIDEFAWSDVVSSTDRGLNGSLFVFQSVKKGGKPFTLQSQEDLGWLTRETINKLTDECNKPKTTFWLDYIADSGVKRVKVMFDHSKTPIEAKPAKGFSSPNPDDPFLVTLRFMEVK